MVLYISVYYILSVIRLIIKRKIAKGRSIKCFLKCYTIK